MSPIVPAIRAHAARGGYVLGICNGFQILTEIGLLPGALTRNAQLRFECGDWHVKVTGLGPFTPQAWNGLAPARSRTARGATRRPRRR